MKRKISVILAVLLIFAMTVPALAETVSLAYKGGALNIRKGPGTQYKSLGTLQHGDYVKVLQYGDVWSKIRTNGGTVGYIKNLYIKNDNTDYAAGVKYFDGSFTVYTTGNVNFRAGASTATKSMGVIAKGTKLTALGENGKFYLVKNAAGTQGFISKTYLSRTKPSASSGSVAVNTKTVTASAVNMRERGTINSDVVKVLPRGTVVTVISVGNYWTYVNWQGTNGWIKNTYLK